MGTRNIKVRIKGISALLMHRYPIEPIEALEKKSKEEQAELAAYRTPAGARSTPTRPRSVRIPPAAWNLKTCGGSADVTFLHSRDAWAETEMVESVCSAPTRRCDLVSRGGE